MRISFIAALLGAIPSGLSLATTTITLTIPPSQILPNPNVLPPTTHATLTTLYTTYTAPLTVSNTFVFRNVSTGSYLADVHSGTHGFVPLRIDVTSLVDDAAAGSEKKTEQQKFDVKVWETYRGNDWGNKGEEVRESARGGFAVRVLGGKAYFMERGSFSVLSILKNPMILLGLVSMGLFFGMPKLVENMDPETKAEWEENQKNNPMNSLLGGGQAGANPMGNFDMAAFLAGQKKDEGGDGGSSSSVGGKKGGRK